MELFTGLVVSGGSGATSAAVGVQLTMADGICRDASITLSAVGLTAIRAFVSRRGVATLDGRAWVGALRGGGELGPLAARIEQSGFTFS